MQGASNEAHGFHRVQHENCGNADEQNDGLQVAWNVGQSLHDESKRSERAADAPAERLQHLSRSGLHQHVGRPQEPGEQIGNLADPDGLVIMVVDEAIIRKHAG